jgi:hypothetical protein
MGALLVISAMGCSRRHPWESSIACRLSPFRGLSYCGLPMGLHSPVRARISVRGAEHQLPGGLNPSSGWVNGVNPSQRPEDLGALTKSQYP